MYNLWSLLDTWDWLQAKIDTGHNENLHSGMFLLSYMYNEQVNEQVK